MWRSYALSPRIWAWYCLNWNLSPKNKINKYPKIKRTNLVVDSKAEENLSKKMDYYRGREEEKYCFFSSRSKIADLRDAKDAIEKLRSSQKKALTLPADEFWELRSSGNLKELNRHADCNGPFLGLPLSSFGPPQVWL